MSATRRDTESRVCLVARSSTVDAADGGRDREAEGAIGGNSEGGGEAAPVESIAAMTPVCDPNAERMGATEMRCGSRSRGFALSIILYQAQTVSDCESQTAT